MKTANIDGDVLKYVAGFACQKTIWTYEPTGEWFEGKLAANDYFKELLDFGNSKVGIRQWMKDNWVDGNWSSEIEVEPWSNCQFILEAKIGEILHETGADEVMIAFTPAETFRHRLAVTQGYKENRKGAPKPEYAQKIVEYLEKTYNCITGDDIEADDVLGQHQTTSTVLASNDKDLMMIPGEHYNFTKGELAFVDPFSADRWFFIQLIAGDPTDNIQGIPGIGMAGATKLVDAYDVDIEGLVHEINNLYEDSYDERWRVVRDEHAALVWILRKGETPETAGWRGLLNAVRDN